MEELWETRSGVVSTQQELAVNLRRRRNGPWTRRPRVTSFPITSRGSVVNSGDSILEALELEARHQVSFWDALVIQAAHAAGVETLYSEDLSDGHGYGTVSVKNPFD